MDAMVGIRARSMPSHGASRRGGQRAEDGPAYRAGVCSTAGRAYGREQAAYPEGSPSEWKYWTAVARVDSAFGDRNLVCTCPPMEACEMEPARLPTVPFHRCSRRTWMGAQTTELHGFGWPPTVRRPASGTSLSPTSKAFRADSGPTTAFTRRDKTIGPCTGTTLLLMAATTSMLLAPQPINADPSTCVNLCPAPSSPGSRTDPTMPRATSARGVPCSRSEDFESKFNGWTVMTASGPVEWGLLPPRATDGFTGRFEHPPDFPGGRWSWRIPDLNGVLNVLRGPSPHPIITRPRHRPTCCFGSSRARQLNNDETIVEVEWRWRSFLDRIR